MGHLFKIKCVDSGVNVHILASTSVPFKFTTVQVPNLSLTHTKRITVWLAQHLSLFVPGGPPVVRKQYQCDHRYHPIIRAAASRKIRVRLAASLPYGTRLAASRQLLRKPRASLRAAGDQSHASFAFVGGQHSAKPPWFANTLRDDLFEYQN